MGFLHVGAFLATVLLLASSATNFTESDPGHVYSTGDWESLMATPGPIRSTVMAYSPDDKIILLYGGRDPQGLLLNDLWIYDTVKGTWTKKTNWICAPSCPSARAVHSIAYDDANNKFVAFGGILLGGHSFETNETWTYDLATNTWTKLDFGTQPVPAPRHWGSIEYNPDDHSVYLFGGHYANGGCPGDKIYNDVWKLDVRESVWTNMNPAADPTAGKPEPRQSDWIYNTANNKFYVFGGKQDLGPPKGTKCGTDSVVRFFNDIWRYDSVANRWTMIQAGQTDYTHYPIERRTDMIYDDNGNRMVMFSGLWEANAIYEPETWIYDFDDSRWSTMQDVDLMLPPIRQTFAATWDDSENIMYIYGTTPDAKVGSFWKLTFISNNISINCFSKQPVQFGTSSDDQLDGNNARNVIYGLTGDDAIRGGKGGDFLCGENGNDTLYGEEGNDKLYGFSGNDEIHGGPGNDNLRGGSGADNLTGGTGADSFDCGTGIDTISDFSPADGDTKKSDCENY